MNEFSFNHLSSSEFEEFCFDLLRETEGVININWRKGTGLSTSPADHGRDIECTYERIMVDGAKIYEKWFVECKHYEKGIPPEAILSAITWASAENPDCLLIIASNFLSNPCKDWIETWRKNNHPKFHILTWERPSIEGLTIGKSRLLQKYQIGSDFPCLALLHPAHILYIRKTSINSLDFFFNVLNQLDPEKRDVVMSWAYQIIIRPRYRKIANPSETLNDTLVDEVSYRSFKQKCYQVAASGVISSELLVFSIVQWVLNLQFGIGDITSVDETISQMKGFEAWLEEKLKTVQKDKKPLENTLRLTQTMIESATERAKDNYDLYVYFCDNVVKKLLQEQLFSLDFK